MDRLTSMTVFIKAVDCGSFAAAGNALNLSPQMVGKHVLALETQVGSTLLHRTTRRQSLTEAGRLYYQSCKRVLQEAEDADRLMASIHAEPAGLLRVNAPVTFGACSLMPAVTRYMRQYPQVQVELTLSDQFVDLLEDGYEAVLRIGRLDDSSLIARELMPYRCVACASPAYLAERGMPLKPADLLEHECLGFTYWANKPTGNWVFAKEGKTEHVHINSRLQINDSKAMLSAALEGFGIVLGAQVLLNEALARGDLVRILPDYETPSRPMHLLFHGDRHLSSRLRTFVDFIVREFSPHPQA
ncbi:LysR family transcriptional regulator [Brenneria goodwinii]|uniref:LysR family transcriptional regulator n=1 Tax=Brenneria goodwinii TaxID=1109412 RepID=UPI000EF25A68|nr:LysR family transcriptional regulator [Brenneria goodwinii]MCG8155917.1 LysR family transcriptional regulator [Brenneria goodwinii]MCG8162310.1 LysR family transcriptional regulator [Brenneria goodwinii]MCG8166969.1 LysR family transcriptional regulator [Brenneria goodwinii]MCG8169643.1 LysR family transcriptional regulator [Brenneria goodwinii]MCG8174751.1 LysR family transcriptional regulator [Brenneria goodwinii]